MRQFVRCSVNRGTVHEIREQISHEEEYQLDLLCQDDEYDDYEPYAAELAIRRLDGWTDDQSKLLVVREGRCHTGGCNSFAAESLEIRSDGVTILHEMCCDDSFEAEYAERQVISRTSAAFRLRDRLAELNRRSAVIEHEKAQLRQAIINLGVCCTAPVIRLPIGRLRAKLRRKAS